MAIGERSSEVDSTLVEPKGHYELQLGSKGFFTIILHNLEDKDIIF
jgi:hypothetical protein